MNNKDSKDFDAIEILYGCVLDYEKNGPLVSSESSRADIGR